MDIGEIRFITTVTPGKEEIKGLIYVKLRKTMYMGFIVGILALLIAFIFSNLEQDINPRKTDLIMFLGIFMLILPLFMYLLSVRISIKQNQKICVPTTFTFGEAAFSEANELTSSVIAYSVIERICVHKNCAQLYINSVNAYLIPLERFEQGDAGAFCAFIEAKTGKRAAYTGKK